MSINEKYFILNYNSEISREVDITNVLSRQNERQMTDTHLQIIKIANGEEIILFSETFSVWEDVWNKYTAILKGEIEVDGNLVRLAHFQNDEFKTIQERRLYQGP